MAGVLGLGLASVAGLFVLAIVGFTLLSGPSGPDLSTPTAQSTRSPYDEPTSRPTRDATPTERPSREPTRRPTRDDEQDDGGSRQVTLNQSLKNNTLYRTGMLPRLTCRAGNVNYRQHQQLKALILKTGKCMDRAWGPILRKQGIPFSPPKWAIVATKGRGACGDFPPKGSIVPYYCTLNNTIYVSTSAMINGNDKYVGYTKHFAWHGVIITGMAHEYGHHVQNLTMRNSYVSQWRRASSQNARLALSRRDELQATCFGGMWMRSVAASYPISTKLRQRLFWYMGRLGDDPSDPGSRTHGSKENNYRWFRQGWEKSRAYQCNTWVVSASATS